MSIPQPLRHMRTRKEIAKLLNVNRNSLDVKIWEAGIKATQEIKKGSVNVNYYDQAAVNQIVELFKPKEKANA